jgi:hypothetical protein
MYRTIFQSGLKACTVKQSLGIRLEAFFQSPKILLCEEGSRPGNLHPCPLDESQRTRLLHDNCHIVIAEFHRDDTCDVGCEGLYGLVGRALNSLSEEIKLLGMSKNNKERDTVTTHLSNNFRHVLICVDHC